VWNPEAFRNWKWHSGVSHAFAVWLRTNPTIERKSYAAMYEPRPRLIHRCARRLVRVFRRGW